MATIQRERHDTATIDITGITGRIVGISPETAAAWLQRNTSNRPLRKSLIKRYSRDMAHGSWHMTGESIKFDRDGNLIDGQHRLLAIIDAGITVECFVMYGIDPSAFRVMDSGDSRKAKDVLHQLGYVSTKELAATATALRRFDALGHFGYSGGLDHPTKSEIIAYVEDHPELMDIVRMHATGTARIPGLRPSLQASLAYLFRRTDAEDCDAFFDALRRGANLHEHSPILMLRNRLIENAATSRKMTANEVAAITIKAWNAWREGRHIRQLSWRKGGANPEAFPQIV